MQTKIRKISNKYNKISLFNFRMLHNTSVLYASNKNITAGSLDNTNLLANIPLTNEAESLLYSNLVELQKQSQQMNSFEFVKNIQSHF